MPDFGDGSPRENYGAVDPYAPSVANGQITPEAMAAYQAKRRRDAILGALSILGMTTGLGAAGQALGAGGAAASAGAGPEFGVGAANTGIWSGAGMTPSAMGAGGAGAGHLFAGMSGRDLAALAAGVTGVAGGALSKPPNMAPNTMTSDPNLQRLLATMQGRLDKSEPLYDSIMSMANGLLPSQYQKGGGGMG